VLKKGTNNKPMKKLLSIFSMSIILISCSPDRVLLNELTDKGTEESPIMYFEGKPFTGVGFDVYSNGLMMFEANYKNGKLDGLFKFWYLNGQLANSSNYKDGELDGLDKGWYEDGRMEYSFNWKDGIKQYPPPSKN
tara:strand:+ start:218 stop:625 length:408 start_codon:yes stop_codon:yes gene_type:complete